MSITNPSQLLSLLTLSSTALPIGAYCYSQGVESAIDRGLIHDEASSIAYFEEVLEMLLVRFELPVLKRLMQYSDDEENFTYWANFYRASRESKELLAESKQLAFSLNAWIRDVLKQPVKVKKQLGFVPVYGSLCSCVWQPVWHFRVKSNRCTYGVYLYRFRKSGLGGSQNRTAWANEWSAYFVVFTCAYSRSNYACTGVARH